MSDKELIARLRSADLYNAKHYARDPLHKQSADRIEALEAKLAKALEALRRYQKTCTDPVTGGWTGAAFVEAGDLHAAFLHARATLAEIKGESHE